MSGRDLQMFITSYRAEDVGKSAQNGFWNIGDLWHGVQLIPWTDATWSPHVEFSRYCQVFDACQQQHCLCLFTCYSESQLNCSENCLTQLVCRHTHTHTQTHTHSFSKLPIQSISSSLSVLLSFTSVSFFAEVSTKTSLQTLKVMSFSTIPVILIQPYHLLSSMQKNWHCGWKMVLAAQSTNQLNIKDYKPLLMPNARSLI